MTYYMLFQGHSHPLPTVRIMNEVYFVEEGLGVGGALKESPLSEQVGTKGVWITEMFV